MDFEVCVRKRKRMWAVRVLCVLMIALIVWFINLDIIKETLQEDASYLFFVGFIVVFLCFFAFSFYAEKRPRIEVKGQNITIYPLCRPSKKITLQEITSRKVKADFSDPQKATVAGVLGGGLLAYAVMQRNAADLQTPSAMVCTYYSGNIKLITVSTRNMDNAERFDRLVADQLEGKPMMEWKGAEQSAIQQEAAEQETRGNSSTEQNLMERNNIEQEIGTNTEDIETPKKTDKKTKAFIIIGLIVAVCVLAVGGFMVVLHMHTLLEQQTGAPAVYTYGDITFEIDPSWDAVEDYDGSFFDDRTGVVYQINGVSQLGSYTPEDFYIELVDFYKQEHDPVISRPLQQSTGTDGAERYMADMIMVKDNIYFYITMVIFPDKDKVITFGAQAASDSAARYEEKIIQTVKDMAASACVADKNGDPVFVPQGNVLAGTSWIADNDGSQWVFREDQSFCWYQTKGITDDNYFAGTYEFYIGQDAIDYLTSELSEYGVTEEEILEVIDRREEYTLDHFVCFSTTNQSFMLNGQEQLAEDKVSSYFGCLLLDGTYLDIVNMNTGTSYSFKKE